MRVAGALQWLHVVCTATLTFCAIHAKHGRDALQSVDPYQALVMTFRGNPPMPRLA